MTDCPRCRERGKTWTGDAPTCGFVGGTFSDANWNCATLNALRGRAEAMETIVRTEGQAAALLPFDGDHIVLGWYKSRGRTECALVLSGDARVSTRPLTLRDAEAALEMLPEREP